MNLQQLEYFLVSARRGSLTKAAEELYTTQPHVSQVIASLERELNECECIQLEDDYFSVEELLMSHKGFHDGRYRIRKVVRTNSDHLMIRMLQQTGLCNIGSYWYEQKGKIEDYNFSITVINGFQNQVSFGYLTPSGRRMRPEAEEFIGMLRNTMRLEMLYNQGVLS